MIDDATMTLAELATLCVRRGVKRTPAVRLARLLFERAYYREAIESSKNKAEAARLAGVRKENLLADLRRNRRKLGLFGL
jgi:hypothetical protein